MENLDVKDATFALLPSSRGVPPVNQSDSDSLSQAQRRHNIVCLQNIEYSSQISVDKDLLIQVYLIPSTNAITEILEAGCMIKDSYCRVQATWSCYASPEHARSERNGLTAGPVGDRGQIGTPRRPLQIESALGFLWFTTQATITALKP